MLNLYRLPAIPRIRLRGASPLEAPARPGPLDRLAEPEAGLSVLDCWVEYVCLGGSAALSDFAEYLRSGHGVPVEDAPLVGQALDDLVVYWEPEIPQGWTRDN